MSKANSIQRLVTPFYDEGGITIYCGDMRSIVPLLPDVDAVITDPPYGETRLNWDSWPDGWVAAIEPKAPQMWCFGSLRMFWDHRADFSGEWTLAQEVIWEKHNGTALHVDRFRKVHELAVHFYQGKWADVYHQPVMTMDATKRKVRRKTKPAHWGSLRSAGEFEVEEGGPRLMRSVIYCRSMHRAGEHPTQKPEGIIRPLIEYSVPPAGLVLDPFMGSGTTLRVAKDLGRRAIGIEANEEYCRIAARRLEQGALLTV